jgi:long-chain acyl-CoA synthetase
MIVQRHKKSARGGNAKKTRTANTGREFGAAPRSAKAVHRRERTESEIGEIDTLADLIPRLAAFAERPALVNLKKQDVEKWTYAKLAEQAKRVANGLTEAGLQKGDPVALYAENGPEWIAVCLGAIAAGAIAVPLDAQLADDALSHVLRDSGARLVFTTTRSLERVGRIAGKLDVEPILLGESANGIRGWQELCAEPAEPSGAVTADDAAVLFYTSGTTGPPKGVPLTHRNLTFQLNTLIAAEIVTGDDRILLPLPLHHVYPFTIGMLAPLTLGLPIVLPYTLTGPQLARALREGSVTTIVGVPRLYRALFDGIQKRAESAGFLRRVLFRGLLALSTSLRRMNIRVGRMIFRRLHREMGPQLRVLASGGAAIEPELAWKLEGLGWLVGTGYGLTETSPLLTLDKPGEARLGSVGRPIHGVEVRIDRTENANESQSADATDSQSQEGEVVARGPSVFAGYHNLPDKTKEAFTEDGWFRTGDLGYFDDDGFLFITGRIKTLIVLEGGEKVQPDEVEKTYQQSDAIREIGILEQDRKLVAVILPNRNAAESDKEQQQAANDAVRKALEEQSKSVTSYQRIADFVLTTNPLPRTRLGKIRREELHEIYEQLKQGKTESQQTGPISEEEMSPEDRVLLDDPAARKTWEWLAGRFSEHRLTPDTSPQLDLGIDSLEWLNLTLEIRECSGVELSEEAISRIETVRDLLREVAEQPQDQQPGAAIEPLENPDEILGEESQRWLTPLGPIELAAAKTLYAVDWVLVHSLFRLSVEGRERLPDHGPFVLTPNHVSYLDSLVLSNALKFKILVETYWAGWTGVAFGPVFRVLRRLAHVVPIDSKRSAASSLAFGATILRSNRNMVWYPEGGHSRTGKLQPFKPGIGMLLEHYPVPVVPVSIAGTREALPPGRWLPRPGRIRVTFGEPLDPRQLEQKGKGDEPSERITSALHDEMAKLCGE